ncbi:MAG: ATP-binding protein, partial [Clostridia bacterium]|nr:ATP-binding protein [Clostridia bacterium]
EQLIAELMSIFYATAAEKEIHLSANWDVPHRYYYGDQTKIKEIFLNVVSNAVKYTSAGGSVSIDGRELPGDEPGWIKVRTVIEDTGIGMSEEFLPHLFDAFTRERNTTTGKVAGTGLGMPIVKKLVDLMHGTIKVESEVGKGTRVTLEIPHRLAEETYAGHAEHAGQDEEAPRPEILQGRHILLAEDNELNAEIATIVLEECGCTVDHAEDGIRCVAMVEQQPADRYDIILMDIQMPNMDGYKAARTIRRLQDKAKANIPIVAMTANAFEEDKQNALKAGMNGHLAKPLDTQKLMATLESILSRKQEEA